MTHRLDEFEADEEVIASLSPEEVRAALADIDGGREAVDTLKSRVAALQGRGSGGPHTPSRPRVERAPQRRPPYRPMRPTRIAWTFGTTALICVGLWVVNQIATPKWLQLADLDSVSQATVQATLPADASDSVQQLRAAGTSTWGLFPRFEREVVEANEPVLIATYQASQSPEAESSERRALSALLLGKTALMRDDPTEAQTWLERAVAAGALPWSEEAATLLEALNED